MGVVISRYSDIAKYDWVAIPLIPYLFSVEDPAEVSGRVNRETVNRIREQYHEAHLLSLGEDVRKGGFLHGGWAELVGVSYERHMYAFRFDTTEAQDDAFIVKMNESENRSHFQLLFNNCADFSRGVLNFYFPHTFGRSVIPDAGMNGMLQPGLIDVQADLFAILIFGQRRVGVAGEAVFIFQFLLGASSECPPDQK